MKKQFVFKRSNKGIDAKIRRTAAGLLALLLLICAAPFSLTPPAAIEWVSAKAQAAAPTSGECGAAVTWSYDLAARALTIGGTGAMQDYGSARLLEGEPSVTTAPWRPFYHEMQTVVIGDDVTSVGNSAFFGCDGITHLTLGTGVTRIGSNAFAGCAALPEIAIPSAVTAVDRLAFSGCTCLTNVKTDDLAAWCRIAFAGTYANPLFYAHRLCLNGAALQSLTIPDGVTSIGNYQFCGCEALTDVTIPAFVTDIGHGAFRGCTGLSAVTIPDSVTSVGQGAFSDCTGLRDVSVGAGVTNISNAMFSGCMGLTDVPAGSGVTRIEDNAFADCTGLTSIAVPAGVTFIGSRAFAGCAGAAHIFIPAGVTAVETEAFAGCIRVTEITVAAENPVYRSAGNCIIRTAGNELTAGCKASVIPADGSITRIGDNAFAGCTGLTSIAVPAGVTFIGSRAFAGCTGLTEIALPESVTSIGVAAFENCTGLTSMSVPGGVSAISALMAKGCTALTSVAIPDGVTTIGRSAFEGCGSLTALALPRSVTAIGEFAFRDCSGLTGISIPDGVESIGDQAFNGCASLAEITIPHSITSIGVRVFYGCTGATRLSIPDGVESIGDEAFLGCAALTSVTIPVSVTHIGAAAFGGCHALTSLNVAAENPVYHSAGNCVIHTKNKQLIQGCSASVIPTDGSVTELGFRSFFCVSSLTEIPIPACIRWIRAQAFYGCTALTSVVFENAPDCIAAHTFENCVGLTRITLPDSVKTIESAAFRGCAGLTRVGIPRSVTRIEKGAFFGCSALADVDYGSTRQNWNAIEIREENDPLFSAALHFNDAFYTVTFLVNGAVYQSDALHAGDRVPEPEDPVAAGYSFYDWTPQIPFAMPERDLTFTAVFEPITYYAIFMADGRQVGEKLPYTVETASITPPDVPEKAGYTGTWETYTLAVGGVTVNAVYTKNQTSPTIKIKNFTATKSVDYKTTVTFAAIKSSAPAGATIHWFIDGRDVGDGETYTVEQATADYTVQCKLMQGGAVLAESEVETVKVNAGFFARLIAFVRSLFRRLPMITLAIKKAL